MKQTIYAGTYTQETSEGIYTFELNEDGTLTASSLFTK